MVMPPSNPSGPAASMRSTIFAWRSLRASTPWCCQKRTRDRARSHRASPATMCRVALVQAQQRALGPKPPEGEPSAVPSVGERGLVPCVM